MFKPTPQTAAEPPAVPSSGTDDGCFNVRHICPTELHWNQRDINGERSLVCLCFLCLFGVMFECFLRVFWVFVGSFYDSFSRFSSIEFVRFAYMIFICLAYGI